MKHSVEDLKKIEKTLNLCASNFSQINIHQLQGTFNRFYSSFNKFFTALTLEKIINVDPYREEYELSKLELPDSSEIGYNEEEYSISIRLSHYSSLLNYIKIEELITLNNLTIDKIRRIINIINFLDWDRIFDPQPKETNTEALNKILFFYQRDRGQQYIISSLKADTMDIYNYAKQFVEEIDIIKIYKDELYKLKIRQDIFSQINFPVILAGENIKKAHKMVTNKIKEEGKPLYIELIGEILKEDYSRDGEKILENTINKLSNGQLEKNKLKSEKKESISPIELLKNSLNELTKFSIQLNSIIEKTLENSKNYREEKFSLLEKFFDFLKYKLLTNKRVTILDLTIIQGVESIKKKKILELEKFIDLTNILGKKLKDYKNIESNLYTDIFSQNPQEIQKVIHKLLSKCRYTYRIFDSINDFYKKELTSPKGVQVELKVMLSSIDNSQALYFECSKYLDETQGANSTYKPDINLAT